MATADCCSKCVRTSYFSSTLPAKMSRPTKICNVQEAIQYLQDDDIDCEGSDSEAEDDLGDLLDEDDILEMNEILEEESTETEDDSSPISIISKISSSSEVPLNPKKKLLTRKRLVNSIDACLDPANFSPLPPVQADETHVGHLGSKQRKDAEKITFSTTPPTRKGNFNFVFLRAS